MPIAALDSGSGGGTPAPDPVTTNHQQLRLYRGMRSFPFFFTWACVFVIAFFLVN